MLSSYLLFCLGDLVPKPGSLYQVHPLFWLQYQVCSTTGPLGMRLACDTWIICCNKLSDLAFTASVCSIRISAADH